MKTRKKGITRFDAIAAEPISDFNDPEIQMISNTMNSIHSFNNDSRQDELTISKFLPSEDRHQNVFSPERFGSSNASGMDNDFEYFNFRNSTHHIKSN